MHVFLEPICVWDDVNYYSFELDTFSDESDTWTDEIKSCYTRSFNAKFLFFRYEWRIQILILKLIVWTAFLKDPFLSTGRRRNKISIFKLLHFCKVHCSGGRNIWYLSERSFKYWGKFLKIRPLKWNFMPSKNSASSITLKNALDWKSKHNEQF